MKRLLVVALVGLAACSSGSHSSTPPPTATTSTTVSPPTTTTAQPPALVAVMADGKLAVLDPATGATRTVLAQAAAMSSVALDRVHQVVYYDTASEPSCHDPATSIFSVPLAGGAATQVVPSGCAPTVSDDGAKLAYAVATNRGIGDIATTIHIRDLATGHESTIADPEPGSNGLPDGPVVQLSWSADGAKLLLSLGSVQDLEGQGVYVVDVASGKATLVPTVPAVPGQRANEVYFEPAAFLPTGVMFANLQCCAGNGNPDPPSSNLVVVDTVTGNVLHTVAVGIPANTHTSLRADESGDWLLYVTNGDLEVSRGLAKPSVLVHGVVSADW
jgi:hypothetical protein